MSRIFIYGSCVSRDAFKSLSEKHTLVKYIARQSLVSAFTNPVKASINIKLDSSFQRRMVAGDLKSNLRSEIINNHKEIDILVVDLTDERLGVDKLTSTMYATHSVELVASGWLKNLKTLPTLIEIGSDKHWKLWSESARTFVAFLEEYNILERTLVVYTPWAEEAESGENVPLFRGIRTSLMSRYIIRCAGFLEGLGLKVVYMPESLSLTTKHHQWGIAPYHYTDSAYRWIADAIENSLTSFESIN
ncbi:DUF6270 domain-containing protein [Arthrobacter sp. LS16]|uniref:DUF6270 domain-containing protein n=1 Tax=Arthrobacter sp. 'calajunan' TaxID=1690248 RepID=UPI003C73A076